jgi:hypothetical protein
LKLFLVIPRLAVGAGKLSEFADENEGKSQQLPASIKEAPGFARYLLKFELTVSRKTV